MVMQVCSKVTSKSFVYRKNRFFSKDLCNALIQPHFDYMCATGYANSEKKNINTNFGVYKTNIYVCAYNWATEITLELNVLT